jgi:hypothetical protein
LVFMALIILGQKIYKKKIYLVFDVAFKKSVLAFFIFSEIINA